MPTDPKQADILNAIRSLERSRRRWRAIAGSIMMVGVGLGVLTAAGVVQPSTIVQTRRLEIVNAQGQVMLSLGSDADGGTFFLFNANRSEAVEAYANDQGRGVVRVNASDGTDRIVLSSNDLGGESTIANSAGTSVARTEADTQGHARLTLKTASGEPRVRLAIDQATQSGLLSVGSAQGQPVFEASADATSRGLVHLFDETGQRSVRLTSDAFGGRLAIRNRAGDLVARAGTTESGQGAFSVFPAGAARASATLASDTAGGRLLLRDTQGDERVAIGVTENRAGQLSIFNQGGLPVFDAYADQRDRGVVLIADELGRRRVTFQVDDDGGALFLLNSADQAIVEAYATELGNGLLLVSDRLRRPRVSVGSDSGGGAIDLWDANATGSPTARVTPD